MEKLEQMKECLTGIVEGQIYSNIEKVDAKELGEVVDMIKDLAEAIYYCTITKAMNDDEKDKSHPSHQGMMYYAPKMMRQESHPIEYYDPRYRERYPYDTMYEQRGAHSINSSSHGGSAVRYPESVNQVYKDGMMKDPHEGRSSEYRKMYMSGKGMKDKNTSMKELENYMQELTTDITEMIQDASMEEKQMLQQKIATLATKIK